MSIHLNAINVFKCGGNILNRLDVSYERLYMATERETFSTKMLDYLLDDDERHDTILSIKDIQEAIIRVMSGTEQEDKYAKPNVNNVTMDNFFQSPVTINTQRKDAHNTNERQIDAYIHADTMKEFKGFTIQSTISDSAHSNLEELVDNVSNYK